MEITVKTKFSPGDKVVVKTIEVSEKLPMFVLAQIQDVKRIVRLGVDFNNISYGIRTFKDGECYSRDFLVDEVDIYSFEEFKKLFDALQPTKAIS
jgi:mannose/fructose/N-acetylgalactosamine-specific phosphotransferase system component IIB